MLTFVKRSRLEGVNNDKEKQSQLLTLGFSSAMASAVSIRAWCATHAQLQSAWRATLVFCNAHKNGSATTRQRHGLRLTGRLHKFPV